MGNAGRNEPDEQERHDYLLADHRRGLRGHGIQRRELESEGTPGPDEGRLHPPGISSYFRIELTVAKALGVLALLVPAVPRKAKEFAYFGFGVTLLSASIAHLLLVLTGSANAIQGPSLPEGALNRIDTIFFSHVPVCRPVRPLTPETLLDLL